MSGDGFLCAGVVLASKTIRPGDHCLFGSHGLRVLPTLTGRETGDVFPAPPPRRATADRGEPGPVMTEEFEGVYFRRVFLDVVRDAWRGVKWALDVQRRERVLYGYVGELLVAIVCEVRA